MSSRQSRRRSIELTTSQPRGILKAALSTFRFLAGVVIVADAAARPFYRPLVERVAGMRAIKAMEAFVARLPRAVILVLFAVPFLVAEPLKVLALVMIAAGAVVPGLLLLLVSYLATFLIVERIYHAGREKLRSYRWFDWAMNQAESVRDSLKSAGREAVASMWRAIGRAFEK
jgi:hypothetical protein